MPAKLALSSPILVNSNTTPLIFNNVSNGYLSGSMMHLNGTGQLVIDAAKLYFVNISVSIEQNGSSVVNTAIINVLQNGNIVLAYTRSYNENDENTLNAVAHLNFNVGDVITANINFSTLSPNKIIVNSSHVSTFLNVV